MAKILVVDDNALNRELIVTLCMHRGHESYEAADGTEALALVQAERPQLVICDILMPTMDGYEFVRQLRADPEIAHTEVIFYTANYRGREAVSLAEAVGVSRVLIKPCVPEDILESIDAALAQTILAHAAPQTESFNREHLRLVTDKLAEKAYEQELANQRLSSLIDLNLQLASIQDPHTLLEQVCRGARELVGARYAFLCIKAKNNGPGTYLFSSGLSSDEAEKLQTPQIGYGMFGQVMVDRLSSRFQNAGGKPQAIGLPASYPAIHHGVIAPITSLNSVYGWLCLVNKVGAKEFSDEDEHILTIHAAQMGRIYENGSLYAQVQQRNTQLQVEIDERKLSEHKVRSLNRVYAVLSQINSLIVRVRQKEDLFREATQIAIDAGQFSMAWIGLLDHDEMRFHLASIAGANSAHIEKLKSILDILPYQKLKNFLKHALKKQALIINDLQSEPKFPLKDDLIASGCRSLVSLPLVVENETIAFLALHADVPGFFNTDEMKLLLELSQDIAFAVNAIDKSEKLHYAAYYDSLTGLANSTLFHERLTHRLGLCHGNQHVALALLDVVHFKQINDALGRANGDFLLKQVADRISGWVGNPDYVARLSADHFAVILPVITEESEAMHAVRQLCQTCFDQEFKFNEIDLKAAAKVGIAIYPMDGIEADSLFKNAESALKKAKISGEPYLFYSAAMNDRVVEKLSLENKLRRALQNEEFELYYQPKVATLSRQIVGVEALIRWNSPDMGLVLPGEFIPILENTGLILEVGTWALSKARMDYESWLQLGLRAPRIAVNVSAIQLRQNNFVEVVKQAVSQGKLPFGLDIEITESVIMEDIMSNTEKLHAIRNLGINISVDDFGTGYSSLAYLALLPVQMIKIDRSFIITMLNNSNTKTLVLTIITLAHSLGMKVIAEGVEQEEQAKLLREMRCDEIQGYLYSKPVPYGEILPLLKYGLPERLL